MARGRIIDAVISNSRKVNSVSDQAALLFTWIQAHTDDFGRIEAGADDVLFSIVPRRNWSKEKVEEYLKEIWEIGLVRMYHADGKRYLEVIGFDEHQTFRSDRARKPKCPVPTEYDTQWYTNDTQREKIDTEVKLSKAKLSKAKLKPKAPVGKPTETAPKTATEVHIESQNEVIRTPKEKAKLFFEGVVKLTNKEEVPWLKDLLTAIAATNQSMQKGVIWGEIKAFTDYWTELTHTGQRQRWECQKTFEVEKRLKTWFSRAGFKSFSASAKSGKGKTIIGLDEDENAI